MISKNAPVIRRKARGPWLLYVRFFLDFGLVLADAPLVSCGSIPSFPVVISSQRRVFNTYINTFMTFRCRRVYILNQNIFCMTLQSCSNCMQLKYFQEYPWRRSCYGTYCNVEHFLYIVQTIFLQQDVYIVTSLIPTTRYEILSFEFTIKCCSQLDAIFPWQIKSVDRIS